MKKIKYFYHFLKINFFFIFIPSKLYKIYNGSKLMSKKERIDHTNNLYDDFLIPEHPLLCDEINIILRGDSFKKNTKINKLIPTFIVNPSEYRHYSEDDIFVTSDGGIFEKYYKNKIPIFFISGGSILNNKISYRELHIDKNDFTLFNKLRNQKLII